MITLGSEARLIVPHNDKENRHVDVAEYQRMAAEIAGGATRTDGFGSWINDDGELVQETVAILDIACGDQATDNSLFDLAAQVAEELNQDAVYYRDRLGNVHLVTAEDAIGA